MVRKELPSCRPLFLKLVSTKGCQGFQETKVRKGGSVLLAVLNLYVRIKFRVATFNTNHSVTDSTQTINRSFNQELPDSVVKSVSRDRCRQSRYVRRNDQVIDQFDISLCFFYMQCNKR